VRPLLRVQLREPAGGRVALVAGRRTHDLPASTSPALAALLAAGELKVGDLPGLDPADQLTLARRLVTESIAIVPDAVAGGA
jgi:lysine-specific demethylase/histidyl-hydroxylase NO66